MAMAPSPSSSSSASMRWTRRASRARRWPSAASARAVAAPMPDEAPVMTATRPCVVSLLMGESPLGSVDADVAEPADPVRLAVVEEQRLARLHLGDAGHLVVGELEVDDVDVLRHALRADRHHSWWMR